MDKLLPHKTELEKMLKERLGTLFGIQYDLFLYDVTSTYVEGSHDGSELLQRGYSRDGRPDCKQACIALVVTREGLPLGYEVFSGNTHDSQTVETIVEKMEKQYGKADRIWVMDRGMVSEKNLEMLRQSGRRYIIGTPKSSMKKMEKDILKQSDWQTIRDGVEVKLCPSPEHKGEVFILCKSRERARKEQAMHERFIRRIEEGLKRLDSLCLRSSGKDVSRIVERRVGRLLQQNSRGASFFQIETLYDKKKRRTILQVDRKDNRSHWLRQTEGHYMLRSNITDWHPKQLWEAYIHLTDAEEAFRIQKSDLHIRPLWHQKDERIRAHVLICFLAFVMWKTFGLMCQKAGLGDEPRRIFNEIKRICMADVVLTNIDGHELRIRSIIRPEKPCQVLLNRLGLRLPARLVKTGL
jgi:transposase